MSAPDRDIQTQLVHAGEPRPSIEGAVVLPVFQSATFTSRENETYDDIRSGKLHPFRGPINDQSGKEVVAAGQVADDGMLAGMNFYIEGIDGEVPK